MMLIQRDPIEARMMTYLVLKELNGAVILITEVDKLIEQTVNRLIYSKFHLYAEFMAFRNKLANVKE